MTAPDRDARASEPVARRRAEPEQEAIVAPGAVSLLPVTGLSAGPGLRRHYDAAEADPLGGTAIPDDVVTTLRRQRGGGQPLPEGLQRAGSEALGRDLSPVRVHTGPEAARLARSVQASAFTYGHDIYFSAGAYRPGEAAGQRLISHELGHIGQDSGATGGVIGRADDPAEIQADRAATGVLTALRRQAVRVDLTHQEQSESPAAETGASDRVVGALRRHAVPAGLAGGKVIRRVYNAEDRPVILALPQIENSDERVTELGDFNWSRAATLALAQHAPAPTYQQMRAIMGRVKATEVGELREAFGNWADLATLAGLGWRGADLNVLLHSEWQAADILALAQAGLQYTPQELKALAIMSLGAQPPTVAQLTAIGRFTFDQLTAVIYSPDNNGSFQDWDQLVHLAEINGDEAVLVQGAGLADLATHPWLEDQVAGLAENGHAGEKANVAGVVDTRFTCWQWATRGFETAPVSIDLLNRYFGFRTNYPPVFGVLDHVAATEAALSEPPASVAPADREAFLAVERNYLNAHQADMQAIITQWETEAEEGNGRNRDAQRAIMELQLADAGFDVLPADAPARWYICMHERQTNVSWEHWWIRSRNGDVIETFPQNSGGGGLALNFHRLDVNMGDVDIDFRHEVPVRDLLPAQKTIIKREVERQNLPYTDDLL